MRRPYGFVTIKPRFAAKAILAEVRGRAVLRGRDGPRCAAEPCSSLSPSEDAQNLDQMPQNGTIIDAPLRSRPGPPRCRYWTRVLDRGICSSGCWAVGKHCPTVGRIRRQAGFPAPLSPVGNSVPAIHPSERQLQRKKKKQEKGKKRRSGT
jgi:hypothetical protein